VSLLFAPTGSPPSHTDSLKGTPSLGVRGRAKNQIVDVVVETVPVLVDNAHVFGNRAVMPNPHEMATLVLPPISTNLPIRGGASHKAARNFASLLRRMEPDKNSVVGVVKHFSE